MGTKTKGREGSGGANRERKKEREREREKKKKKKKKKRVVAMDRRNVPGGKKGSSFEEISRKTTDEVLKKLKATSKGQAALGALLFSAVFLALIWGIVEYIFGGQVDVLFILMEIVHFFGILVLIKTPEREKLRRFIASYAG